MNPKPTQNGFLCGIATPSGELEHFDPLLPDFCEHVMDQKMLIQATFWIHFCGLGF